MKKGLWFTCNYVSKINDLFVWKLVETLIIVNIFSVNFEWNVCEDSGIFTNIRRSCLSVEIGLIWGRSTLMCVSNLSTV